jgi:hypothetical protein
MTEHAGGSAWLDAVLYDGAPVDTDPLFNGADTIDAAGTSGLNDSSPRSPGHGAVGSSQPGDRRG